MKNKVSVQCIFLLCILFFLNTKHSFAIQSLSIQTSDGVIFKEPVSELPRYYELMASEGLQGAKEKKVDKVLLLQDEQVLVELSNTNPVSSPGDVTQGVVTEEDKSMNADNTDVVDMNSFKILDLKIPQEHRFSYLLTTYITNCVAVVVTVPGSGSVALGHFSRDYLNTKSDLNNMISYYLSHGHKKEEIRLSLVATLLSQHLNTIVEWMREENLIFDLNVKFNVYQEIKMNGDRKQQTLVMNPSAMTVDTFFGFLQNANGIADRHILVNAATGAVSSVQDMPLMRTVLLNFISRICSFCRKSSIPLQLCECRRVKYCSEECRKADWPNKHQFMH